MSALRVKSAPGAIFPLPTSRLGLPHDAAVWATKRVISPTKIVNSLAKNVRFHPTIQLSKRIFHDFSNIPKLCSAYLLRFFQFWFDHVLRGPLVAPTLHLVQHQLSLHEMSPPIYLETGWNAQESFRMSRIKWRWILGTCIRLHPLASACILYSWHPFTTSMCLAQVEHPENQSYSFQLWSIPPKKCNCPLPSDL